VNIQKEKLIDGGKRIINEDSVNNLLKSIYFTFSLSTKRF
jgi:hypothetical protein